MFLFFHFAWATLQQVCPQVFSLQDFSKVAVARKESHAELYTHCLDAKIYGASFTPLTLSEHNIVGVTAFTCQKDANNIMENHVLLLHYMVDQQSNKARNFIMLLAHVSVDDLQNPQQQTRIQQHLYALIKTFDKAPDIKSNDDDKVPEFLGAIRLWHSARELKLEPAPEALPTPKKSFWKTQRQWIYQLTKSGTRVATWFIPYTQKKSVKRIQDTDRGVDSPQNHASPTEKIIQNTQLVEEMPLSQPEPIAIKKIGNTDIYIHKTAEGAIVLGCSIDENAVRQYIETLLLFFTQDLSAPRQGIKLGTHHVQGYGQTQDGNNWLLINHVNDKKAFLTLLPNYKPAHMESKESEDRLVELLDYFSQTALMVQTCKKDDEKLKELEDLLHTKNGACVMVPAAVAPYWGQSWVDWWYGSSSNHAVQRIGKTNVYYQDTYPLKITWSNVQNDPQTDFLDYLVDDQTGSEPCNASFDYCENPVQCKWMKTVKSKADEPVGIVVRFDTLDDFFLIFLQGKNAAEDIKNPGLQPIQTIGSAAYILKTMKNANKEFYPCLSFPPQVGMPIMPGACCFVKRSRTVKTVESWVSYYRGSSQTKSTT